MSFSDAFNIADQFKLQSGDAFYSKFGSTFAPDVVSDGSPKETPNTVSTERTTSRTVGTETTSTTTTTTQTVNQGFLSGWLTRIVVIILGFIFVAIGLYLFGGAGQQIVVKAVPGLEK